MGLRIRMLGPFEIEWDESASNPIVWSRKQTQVLLKILLTERGRIFTDDQLVESLFPNLEFESALANLKKRISELRKILEPNRQRGQESQYVLRVGEGYLFSKECDCWMDIEQFETEHLSAQESFERERWSTAIEQFGNAIELWRGEFLEDEPYEDWAILFRDHWRQRYLELLEAKAECHIRLGEYEQVVRLSQDLLKKAPTREPAYALNMRALAYLGRVDEAEKTFDLCVKALQEELAVEPSRELDELINQIQGGELSEPATAVPNNLPEPRTRFVGRERELQDIHDLLNKEESRLLTLIGPGGIGKTRLALKVAAECAESHIDGVYFVPLAPVGSSKEIIPAIAESVNFSFAGREDPSQQLRVFLREKKIFLVLDNFEHLLDGATVIGDLLAHAPQLNVLATSREKLNLQGETLYDLQGLLVPPLEHSRNGVAKYSAVQLFLECAKRANPKFKLIEESKPQICRICDLVAGMPLAIELAAAWLQTISLDEIAEEIEKSIAFLETNLRDVPARHRSIQVVFESTWERLSEREQVVFMNLSVFRGGFTREASQEVARASISDLMRMLNKSLIYRQPSGRYEVHELLRQFGEQRLVENGEADQIYKHHLSFLLTLTEHAEPELRGSDAESWIHRIESEHDNVKAALTRALDGIDIEIGAQLAGAMGIFWELRSFFTEGRIWFDQFLSHREELPSAINAKILYWHGFLAIRQGDFAEAQELLDMSIELYQQIEDSQQIARLYYTLAGLNVEKADFDACTRYAERALECFRELQDKVGVADSLNMLGIVARNQSRYESANETLEESVALFGELGNLNRSAAAMSNLGFVKTRLGLYQEAHDILEESLEIDRKFGNTNRMLNTMTNMGVLMRAQSDTSGSLKIYEEILQLADDLGNKYVMANVLQNMGEVNLSMGNLDVAESLTERSLQLARDTGSKKVEALALCNLGFIRFEQGILEESAQLFQESIVLRKDFKDDFILWNLLGVACVSLNDNPAYATRLIAATQELTQSNRFILESFGESILEQTLAKARDILTGSEFEKHWEEGSKLDLDQAIELVLKHK
jgi:predicted ATPase/DNA-binding SARP family transcriptional activator/Tfp pilus assembly protein PilF